MVDHHDESGSSPPPPQGQGKPIGEPSYSAPQTPENGSRHSGFPLVLGAAMVLVLIGAWFVSTRPKEPAPAPPAATGAAAPAPVEEKPAELAPEAKALKADLDGLKTDLKAIQDRIESLPKPAPPVDLGPLNTKLSDLAAQTESLASLPKKVGDLDQRLDTFDKTLATVRGDLDALKSDAKKTAEAAPAGSTADTGTADAAVQQAAGLFKAGKYKDATDAFQKLTESNPDDARVFYFAALSRGSSTNQWTGETTRLVEKAVALEKTGTPATAKIDAAFADLNPSFKPWLDAYRKTAKAQ
jgi:TolA-binding protein